MEADAFLELDCCTVIPCVENFVTVFIFIIGTCLGRWLLVFSKIGGIALDCFTIYEIAGNIALMTFLIMYLVVDRLGAAILLCIYGYKPTDDFKKYAYYMAKTGKIKNEQGLLSLYYGSLFSCLDFMGQIWKSYIFCIDVEPENTSVEIEMGQVSVNMNTTKKGAPKQSISNEKSSCKIYAFALFYFVMLLALMFVAMGCAIVSTFEVDLPFRAMVLVYATNTMNTLGIAGHYINLGSTLLKRSRVTGKGCCCCAVGCNTMLCVIATIVGIGSFLFIQMCMIVYVT